MQNLNPTFKIEQSIADPGSACLLLLAGRPGLSILCINKENSTLNWLKVYHFEKNTSDVEIASLAEKIFSEDCLVKKFSEVKIVWSFEQFIMVPSKFYNTGTSANMLELVYGNVLQGSTQNDFVYGHNVYTIYKVPAIVKKVFIEYFPNSTQSHQASLMIDLEKEKTSLLYAVFYPNYVTVLLRKENRLQIIQQFEFTQPEDVAFYLLNTCSTFSINPADTELVISGMINADSKLYAELFKYFQTIEFGKLPVPFTNAQVLQQYPAPYFSNLFSLASCV
jgi:Protein of unknown function (DUF3822)